MSCCSPPAAIRARSPGSDQENPNVWLADVTNLAGDKMLVTQSYAMTAVKVSDGILIFTANDAHKMVYVGAPYAYGISQIATGCGPLSPRAVVGIGSFLRLAGRADLLVLPGQRAAAEVRRAGLVLLPGQPSHGRSCFR